MGWGGGSGNQIIEGQRGSGNQIMEGQRGLRETSTREGEGTGEVEVKAG